MTRRRTFFALAAMALVSGTWLWTTHRPIDPRLVGRWTWSDRPGVNYPIIEFHDDGIAQHLPWGEGMFRTFMSGVHWWSEGGQIVVQYPARSIQGLHTFTLWLKEKLVGGPQKHRFNLLEVTTNQILWQSVDEDPIETTLHRILD
jgi:hypothetical protein